MRVELDWKEIKNEFDFTLLDYDDICFDEYQYQEAKKQADEYLKENKICLGKEFKEIFTREINSQMESSYFDEYNKVLMKLFGEWISKNPPFIEMEKWDCERVVFKVNARQLVTTFREENSLTRKETIEEISAYPDIKSFVKRNAFGLLPRKFYGDISGYREFDYIYGEVYDIKEAFENAKSEYDYMKEQETMTALGKWEEMVENAKGADEIIREMGL